MTFVRSVIHQWSKAQLGHSLMLSLRGHDQVRQLFGGATQINTVTNLIAALVYSEGEPEWLGEHELETILDDDLVLHCLFLSSRAIFIQFTQDDNLSQAERLILTLGKVWASTREFEGASQGIAQLMKKVCGQVDALILHRRLTTKNMR